MGGTNDACGRLDAEEVEGNIRYMVETSLEQGILPILGLPIPCNYLQDEHILRLYRADMQEYALAKNLPVIDFFTAFLKSVSIQADVSLYADVLHPNERGYQVMAATAVKVLQTQNSKNT
jgi:lysophospholipase L1-like esterase